jgi:hypothetical protein
MSPAIPNAGFASGWAKRRRTLADRQRCNREVVNKQFGIRFLSFVTNSGDSPRLYAGCTGSIRK